MGDRGKDGLARWSHIWTIITVPFVIFGVVVTVVMCILTFVGLYLTIEPFRVAVTSCVRFAQRCWPWGLVIVALVVVVLVTWLDPRVRRRVVGGFKKLRGVFRRAYLWMLWHLVVRPARDHFGGMIAIDSTALGPGLGPELDEAVRGMSPDARQVLAAVLEAYDPEEVGPFLTRASSIQFFRRADSRKSAKRVHVACTELENRRLLSTSRFLADNGMWLQASLGPLLSRAVVCDMRAWVDDQIKARGDIL